MAFFGRMLYSKLTFTPAAPTTTFTNQTVIVTGANSGLGLAAAQHFVSLNAALTILAVRNLPSGQAAVSRIEQATGRTNCLEIWELDMASYDSIRAFAQRVAKLARVDVVVLNAGLHRFAYHASEYGWEHNLQVNVLGTAYLTLLLLPVLRAKREKSAKRPVLEVVGSSSMMHLEWSEKERGSESLLKLWNEKEGYEPLKQYIVSKLAVMYAVQSMAERVIDGEGKPEVLLDVVCPGPTRTDLAKDANSFLINIGKRIFELIFQRPADVAARTYVTGVELGPEAHGEFWYHDQIQKLPSFLSGAEGEKFRSQVWHDIVDAIRKDAPDVLELVKPAA